MSPEKLRRGEVTLTRAGRAAAPRCLPGNRTECASARCSRPKTGWLPGRQQSPVSRSLCKKTRLNACTIFVKCDIYILLLNFFFYSIYFFQSLLGAVLNVSRRVLLLLLLLLLILFPPAKVDNKH